MGGQVWTAAVIILGAYFCKAMREEQFRFAAKVCYIPFANCTTHGQVGPEM